MEESRDHVPLALFGYFRLDLRHGSTIGSIVSELAKPCVVGLTYVVNWLIAVRID